jgi:hypothetical protein
MEERQGGHGCECRDRLAAGEEKGGPHKGNRTREEGKGKGERDKPAAPFPLPLSPFLVFGRQTDLREPGATKLLEGRRVRELLPSSFQASKDLCPRTPAF